MGRCPLQSSLDKHRRPGGRPPWTHDSSDLTISMWRTATIQGLPPSVQTKLEDCVGLDEMAGTEWQAQVTHHMNKHTEAQDKYGDEMKVLQRRLMVAQVSEHEGTKAERKTAAAAKIVKPPTAEEVADLVVKQMTAIQPLPTPQPLMQVPPLCYGPQQQQQYGQYQQPQGPYQHQPQGGRGGWAPGGRGGWAPRGRGRGTGNTTYFCYNCGGPGHIARNCRLEPQQKGPPRGQGCDQPREPPYQPPPQRQANMPYPVPYDVDPATQTPLREWRNE
ncbi:unnamed protein product [Pleuronectes platessa]|uniref:CCHC-type domain-containing protein n=1 Tax=Pleuronectes platessa TaxID=8262 RepID=A0A9N7Y815_PLEPL|nr:unnamed protein product [Pleuronectes platessa]